MMLKMPQYEVRYHDKLTWEEISELDLMHRLHENYDHVSPVIELMIEGEYISTPEAVFHYKD